MDKNTQDLDIGEVSELKSTFSKIGEDIQLELNQRIRSFNSSMLYKNYANLFYFIPKHCFLEIQGTDHSGYHITPDQPFFVKDKKSGNNLKFTPRLETVIAPVKAISTKSKNDFFIVELDFENNFEYDNFTLWLNPIFVKDNKYLARSILRKILKNKPSEMFAEVSFSDDSKAVKNIKLNSLSYQLKPIEVDAMAYHSSHTACGFNIRLENLFNYNYDKVKKITLFLKGSSDHSIEDDISDLFKINMVPIFNSYEGYSYTVNADMRLSEVKLKHEKNDYAVPLSVLSVYENNEKIDFDNFFFKGQNEYYFNLKHQTLDYNVLLPDLSKSIENVRMYAYASWTDDIDLSDNITVNSNDLSSISCKTIPINIRKENSNYKISLEKVFSLIEKLNPERIFSKSAIEDILSILLIDHKEIELFLELVENIEFEKIKKDIYISVKQNYFKQYYTFLEFMMEIICSFINRNTSIYIRNFFIK